MRLRLIASQGLRRVEGRFYVKNTFGEADQPVAEQMRKADEKSTM